VGGSSPAYIPYDSNRGWHVEWFYIRNPVEAPCPAFTGGRPKKQDSWSWGPSYREKLVRRSLDGARLFHTLYHRRVAPLAKRAQPMWRYGGPSDLDHASPKELPNDEV